MNMKCKLYNRIDEDFDDIDNDKDIIDDDLQDELTSAYYENVKNNIIIPLLQTNKAKRVFGELHTKTSETPWIHNLFQCIVNAIYNIETLVNAILHIAGDNDYKDTRAYLKTIIEYPDFPDHDRVNALIALAAISTGLFTEKFIELICPTNKITTSIKGPTLFSEFNFGDVIYTNDNTLILDYDLTYFRPSYIMQYIHRLDDPDKRKEWMSYIIDIGNMIHTLHPIAYSVILNNKSRSANTIIRETIRRFQRFKNLSATHNLNMCIDNKLQKDADEMFTNGSATIENPVRTITDILYQLVVKHDISINKMVLRILVNNSPTGVECNITPYINKYLKDYIKNVKLH